MNNDGHSDEQLHIGRLSGKDPEVLRLGVIDYLNWLSNTVVQPVQASFQLTPPILQNVMDSLSQLNQQILATAPEYRIDRALLPWLKRSIIHKRLLEAATNEERHSRTFNTEVGQGLDDQIGPIERIIEQDWFKEITAAKSPKLTDFLTVIHADTYVDRTSEASLAPRQYDEKFNILTAPALFRPDLRHYRVRCAMRGIPLVVAYIDIDDFKEFNTQLGEPTVDREVLPRFMSELEAHTFSRGHAYRFGGDEYVLILPNASMAEAAGRLHYFQVGLNALRFSGIEKSLAVSIGVVEVSDDCPLTDGEVEERAAHAKQYAKDHGKNCIGGYKGPFYSDDELEIISDARGG